MSKGKNQSVDFMAVGAHPDDVELLAGGTILKLSSLGRRGVVVDLTRGEKGTRGEASIRLTEAKKAAAVLKAAERITLDLPDAGLKNKWEMQKPIIALIRSYRPKVLLTHYGEDEHPDHRAASQLVRDSWYLAGLQKIDCPGVPYRPGRIFYFLGSVVREPDFCVDISDFWKAKLKAISCFESQFYGKGSKKFSGKTDIASRAFMEFLETRFRFYGTRIKRRYAEPFLCSEIPEIQDITALGGLRF